MTPDEQEGIEQEEPPFVAWTAATDETGYGSLAGNMYVCGVLVHHSWHPPAKVRDSKDLPHRLVQELADKLMADEAVSFVLLSATPEMIDRNGVGNVLIAMHREAHEKLQERLPEGALCHKIADGNLALGFDIKSQPGADATVLACSAASIIAKAAQTRHMQGLNAQYPGYDFASSHGYPSDLHKAALVSRGPCPAHRQSYGPVSEAQRAQAMEPAFDVDELMRLMAHGQG